MEDKTNTIEEINRLLAKYENIRVNILDSIKKQSDTLDLISNLKDELNKKLDVLCGHPLAVRVLIQSEYDNCIYKCEKCKKVFYHH